MGKERKEKESCRQQDSATTAEPQGHHPFHSEQQQIVVVVVVVVVVSFSSSSSSCSSTCFGLRLRFAARMERWRGCPTNARPLLLVLVGVVVDHHHWRGDESSAIPGDSNDNSAVVDVVDGGTAVASAVVVVVDRPLSDDIYTQPNKPARSSVVGTARSQLIISAWRVLTPSPSSYAIWWLGLSLSWGWWHPCRLFDLRLLVLLLRDVVFRASLHINPHRPQVSPPHRDAALTATTHDHHHQPHSSTLAALRWDSNTDVNNADED